MKVSTIKVFSLFIFLFLSVQAWADVWDKLQSTEYEENDVEDYVWKEEESKIPDYPEDSDLVEVSGVTAYPNYKYLIDVKNLQVGADKVVRYSLVIRSPSGSDNAFFEGVRCTGSEVKTYAYGITDMNDNKKFVARTKPVWKQAASVGVKGYGQSFIANYLCGFNGKNIKRNEIIQNIKYGKGTVDGNYD